MASIRFKTTAITIAEILTAIACVFFASFAIIQGEIDRRSVEIMSLIAQDTKKWRRTWPPTTSTVSCS